MLTVNNTSQDSVDISSDHSCEICTSKEYEKAKEILQRSGLVVRHWGFLLHDITSNLLGKGNYTEQE